MENILGKYCCLNSVSELLDITLLLPYISRGCLLEPLAMALSCVQVGSRLDKLHKKCIANWLVAISPHGL